MGIEQIRAIKKGKKKDRKIYRIKKFSKKRSRENAEYRKGVKKFLQDNPVCVVNGTMATECHHTEGRIGKRLLDFSKCLPVSSEGHKWIHDNPKEAKKLGFSSSRLNK